MMNVVVIGAGPHCTTQHAPALVHFRERHPDKINLSAICDLNADRAERAREAFGFEKSFTSVGEMLAQVEVHAVVAVLPHTGTLSMLEEFMRRGIPLVMEKPLGANLAEARSIAQAVERHNAHVMVSLNRRFDPGLLIATDWLKSRGPIRYLVGSMLRVKRTEPDFIWGTGIHLLDAMVSVAGPLKLAHDAATALKRPGGFGCIASLSGEDGLVAVAEILPVSGREEERLRIVGDDYCVDVWTGSAQLWSVRGYQGGELALENSGTPDESLDLQNGTFNETEALLLAALEGRPLSAPSVMDALHATELAAQLQDHSTQ